MRTGSQARLSQRIDSLRWQLPLLAFVLVLTDQLIAHTWLANVPSWVHFASQVFFYGLSGSVLAWWALTLLRRRVREVEAAQHSLQQAHTAVKEANQRLEFLIRVNRRLAEAEDEEALVDVILNLPAEVVPTVGCSLTRFDERGRPLPAIHRGALDPAIFDAWAAHLSAPEGQVPCETCCAARAINSAPCPLARSPLATMAISHVHCLELARAGRQYGLLNIYIGDASYPDPREEDLLSAMASEVSTALESHTLRSRELEMLYHLQQTRQHDNLKSDLLEMLAHAVGALRASGGALFLVGHQTPDFELVAEVGSPSEETLSLMQGLAQGSRVLLTPVTIGDLKRLGSSAGALGSLLIAPLRSGDGTLGSLVLWADRRGAFTRRRVRLVSALTGQLSLLVENHRLFVQAEHQIALEERTRLAREIHDGLAQNLGYLKLRAAQIAGWLEKGELGRVGDGLREVQELLSDTYLDAREAIDGLRLEPGAEGPDGWLDRLTSDFRVLSGVELTVTTPPQLPLSPEVRTQLIRIVQEALSNIRKHADATRASLEWKQEGDWLTLHIADNGRGFDAADVPPISQHGLRIMRERAELLDGDFQIISRSGGGTQIVIRLPVVGVSLEDPKGWRNP